LKQGKVESSKVSTILSYHECYKRKAVYRFNGEAHAELYWVLSRDLSLMDNVSIDITWAGENIAQEASTFIIIFTFLAFSIDNF
jgi:hypothetical protein